MVKEFMPTILFLAKFLAVYLLINVSYGYWVKQHGQKADPATRFVTEQCAAILSIANASMGTSLAEGKPNVLIKKADKSVLAVYEGCNGINVMAVFIAFVLAFGKPQKAWLWFVPIGLLAIHLTNLARIVGLFYVSEYIPNYMYFTHKYLFTAVIYVVVLLMWYYWVSKVGQQAGNKSKSHEA